MELIDSCKKGISLPQFSECFRERTEDWWETFAEMEAELRQMMDEDKDHTRGAELVAQMQETLNLVFDEISFEMGFNGEKYELILTPEGDKVKLFELIYFQKHASKEVLEHWNILVGRQPLRTSACAPRMDGISLGMMCRSGWRSRVKTASPSPPTAKSCCPCSGRRKAGSGGCSPPSPTKCWARSPTCGTLTISMCWRTQGRAVYPPVPAARQTEGKGANLSTDPNAYLESYLGYEMKPNEDPDADWRLDVMAGTTKCVPLLNGYLNADNDFMDNLHADGAVAGFFCYPLDTLREEEGTEKIFDFRDKLEELFTTGDGPEVLTLIGGATGLFCGYVDFIAWDIGRRSRWQRSSSSAATSPGPASTPSVEKQAL